MDSRWIEKERRQHARFDFSGMLFFQMTVSANHLPPPNEGTIQRGQRSSASIKNVGGRGCCITLDRPLRKSQIIKMDFPLFQARLSIPTLAEIRWVRMEPELNQYTMGLRYLL